jgi:hypothetical protein
MQCACVAAESHVIAFVQLFSSLGFAAAVGPLCLQGRCVWGGYEEVFCVLVVIFVTKV